MRRCRWRQDAWRQDAWRQDAWRQDAWRQKGDLFRVSSPHTPAGERWVVVRTTQGEERVRTTLQRQVETTRAQWEKALWHLGNQRFACEPDAQAALEAQLKQRPEWLTVQANLIPHPASPIPHPASQAESARSAAQGHAP
jgi:hypothetical protein